MKISPKHWRWQILKKRFCHLEEFRSCRWELGWLPVEETPLKSSRRSHDNNKQATCPPPAVPLYRCRQSPVEKREHHIIHQTTRGMKWSLGQSHYFTKTILYIFCKSLNLSWLETRESCDKRFNKASYCNGAVSLKCCNLWVWQGGKSEYDFSLPFSHRKAWCCRRVIQLPTEDEKITLSSI